MLGLALAKRQVRGNKSLSHAVTDQNNVGFLVVQGTGKLKLELLEAAFIAACVPQREDKNSMEGEL